MLCMDLRDAPGANKAIKHALIMCNVSCSDLSVIVYIDGNLSVIVYIDGNSNVYLSILTNRVISDCVYRWQ